jgi:hypothetical protein
MTLEKGGGVMDLKEFVAETLTQIIDGVKEAQRRTEAVEGTSVNPHLSAPPELARYGILNAGGNVAQVIQFDVALTAMEGTGTKGGIGVVAGVFNLGSAGQSQTENSSVSRVKFSVPLALPRGRRILLAPSVAAT